MKTIEKKYYMCDVCGRVSQNREKIDECQELHRIISDDVSVLAKYEKGQEYPDGITLTWPDGATAKYYLAQ